MCFQLSYEAWCTQSNVCHFLLTFLIYCNSFVNIVTIYTVTWLPLSEVTNSIWKSTLTLTPGPLCKTTSSPLQLKLCLTYTPHIHPHISTIYTRDEKHTVGDYYTTLFNHCITSILLLAPYDICDASRGRRGHLQKFRMKEYLQTFRGWKRESTFAMLQRRGWWEGILDSLSCFLLYKYGWSYYYTTIIQLFIHHFFLIVEQEWRHQNDGKKSVCVCV